MNKYYFLYKILTIVLFSLFFFPALLFIVITGKYKKHAMERFGYIPEKILKAVSASPRIWVHAVSLGEIKVACSIISALNEVRPDCSVVLSTTTEHGRELAIELMGNHVPVIYSPVDLFFIVKKALRQIDPDVMVFLETEIWPAWIIEAHRAGVRTVLLNGRISKKSIKSYLRFRSFFKNILSHFDMLSMISEVDKNHILQMGADTEKTVVNGNAKYDILIEQTSPGMDNKIRKTLKIEQDKPVIVAGSTRNGEEEILLKAFSQVLKAFPEAILIIAPRHLKRLKEIIDLLNKNRLGYNLRSELDDPGAERDNNILIIDRYGELFNIYSIGTLAFCGASLVPLGGQNPLEPAAWGTPVFHGPYMDHFLDAKKILQGYNANIEVSGCDDFAEKVIYYLKNPELLREKGVSAKMALMNNQDASKKHAGIITSILRDC